MTRLASPILCACAALGLAGCVHRVDVVTSPAGAIVQYAGETPTPSPNSIRVQMGGARAIRASLGGYRTVTVRLPLHATTTGFLVDVLTLRWRRAFGGVPYTTVELRLVPEHGGVGTWDPEDVGG